MFQSFLMSILDNPIGFDEVSLLIIVLLAYYVLLQTILQYNINPKSNGFLVALMVHLSISTTISFLANFSFPFNKYLLFIHIPNFLFISPNIYLYVKSLLESDFIFDKKAKCNYILPVGILSLFMVFNVLILYFFYQKNLEDLNKVADVFIYLNIVAIIAVPTFQLLYHGLVLIKKYRQHLKSIENIFSNYQEAQMNWLKYLLIFYAVFMVLFVFVSLHIESIAFFTEKLYHILMFLIVIFIGIYGTRQSNIFQRVQFESLVSANSFTHKQDVSESNASKFVDFKTVDLGEPTITKTNKTSVISEDRKEEIKLALISLMENEKPFLHPSLKITDLTEKLQTNQKYLSVVINECFEKNFLSFINDYRIKEAMNIFALPDSNQYTVEGIGNMVGFKSRSAFINAFKKHSIYVCDKSF